MDSLLNRIVKEHERLLGLGKEPDSLYLSKESRETLGKQAAVAYGIQKEAAMVEFLGMCVYTGEQYRGEMFKIYCKPQFHGEF